ncbi:EIF2B4 [Mytilus edulis]|uniref:Translation initiation factor eIF2B subunit delta n=1 Tax=Mytilus edulis TaxID=6550 RepID=A0A8S3PZV6_MYTED|nr:EIF2B4 [Mytilus edulis]
MADDVQAQKKMAKKLEKQKIPQRTKVQRQVRLFEHLHQYEREVSLTQSLSFRSCTIHPAIVRLGVHAEGVICGSNARCLAMLVAFKQVIADYTTPAHKELSRDLEARIKPYISMGNAIKYLKYNISCGTRDLSETEAKQNLIDTHEHGIKFRVIVIDGRPRLEGKEMLRRLVRAGIKCSYMLINAVSYAMQEATKVFLGAHACLPMDVMSRSDPDDLVNIGNKTAYLSDWRDYNSLTLLNLVYDVTPWEFVSVVITELGLIPCTSVPVVLRMKQVETAET